MLINIDENILERGVIMGWGMGNLKILWQDIDVSEEILVAQIQEREMWHSAMLQEFKILAPYAMESIDNTSYDTFKNSIYLYFLANNINFYYSILLGETIFWIVMLKSTKQKNAKQQMYDNIDWYLNKIPEDILADKRKFIKFVSEHSDDNVIAIAEGLKKLNTEDNSIDSRKQLNRATNLPVSADYVFISYSCIESDIAHKIYDILEANGIKCWIAPENIVGGADYTASIPEAIRSCKIFLIVLSENSQNSKWVPKELDLAITHDKVILPFHIDNSSLKASFNFRLTNIQRIDAYGKLEKGYNTLVNLIHRILEC